MKTEAALQKLSDVIRRKHLALKTEQSYCAWLKRYCHYIKQLPAGLPSEQKLERFLTALARQDVAASTQNQAFNAIIFFYQEALGVALKNIQALRARRPQQLRHAPSREDTLRLLKTVQAEADFATSLAVRLLYGCGLRVTEPLSLRVKDVDLESSQFIIRAAKGGKDRVVAIPCSALEDLRQQIESAREMVSVNGNVTFSSIRRAGFPCLAAKYVNTIDRHLFAGEPSRGINIRACHGRAALVHWTANRKGSDRPACHWCSSEPVQELGSACAVLHTGGVRDRKDTVTTPFTRLITCD